MKAVPGAAVILALVMCTSLSAEPGQAFGPIELEKLVVTPSTGGVRDAEPEPARLRDGESKTFVAGNEAVVYVLGTREGVEIYVDGELLGVSKRRPSP